MKNIILGSGSPRRRELLATICESFTVDTGNSFEESMDAGTDPRMIPVLMAQGKSHGFHRSLGDDEVLITSDTVVILEEAGQAVVMGKPKGAEDAAHMLRMLSGKTHEVITAVTIRDAKQEKSFADTTYVTFKELTDKEIAYYIEKYQPFDKAGAYGIQEWIGYIGISKIEGSYFTVMGFPVHRVYEELQGFLKAL